MLKQFNINLDEKTKVIVISVAIVFITLFTCSGIVKHQTRKSNDACSKIEEERKKLVLRAGIGMIESKQNEYLKYFYDTMDQQGFRFIISGFAAESGIEIVSMKSSGSKAIANLSRSILKVSLKCTYNQLVEFIAKVEELPELMRIEELSVAGLIDFKGYLTGDEDEKQGVMESDTKAMVSLTVAAYSIKH